MAFQKLTMCDWACSVTVVCNSKPKKNICVSREAIQHKEHLYSLILEICVMKRGLERKKERKSKSKLFSFQI